MKVAPERALQILLVVHLRELQTVQGEDITDTASFINSFSGKDSNVALFKVSRKEVEKNSTSFSKLNLKPIPGTLQMHQMFTTPFREIEYRYISCFCRKDGEHPGHELTCFKFDVPNTGNKENKKTTKQEEKSRKKKTEHEKTNNSRVTDLNSGDRETNERQLFSMKP